MIRFEKFPLPESTLKELTKLRIEYVFQSIFYPDGKTVYAREALMRPYGTPVMSLIHDYTRKGLLHILELASFFGATQEYVNRGYREKLAINSFPCECFSENETAAFVNHFRKDQDVIIIELLEFPSFSYEKAMVKKDYAKIGKSQISLDDFGAGFNDIEKVRLIGPDIIKLDRTLVSCIDRMEDKKIQCRKIIDQMHGMGIRVVAEGVETKQEFDCLVEMGADYFQGYYLEFPA